MQTFFKSFVISVLFAGLSLCVAQAQPAWHDQVGYTALKAEFGAALEDGSGLKVAQPEAESTLGSGLYMPNPGATQFAGKDIKNGTVSNTFPVSSHATSVGQLFYGTTSSISPGITDITGYDANHYINTVIVNGGGNPQPQGFDITNHSYVVRPGGANPLTETQKVNLLRRFDFVINRDNTVAVVGADNGANSLTPDLWAPSFNAITVGVTSGNHSNTLTTNYPAQIGGAGRIKPDIVAPAGNTSTATPMVASAAAILRDAGTGTNAARNEVIKSMLFAGATKEEFASWDRTVTRPIDERFGFGELNIYNSYHILKGGEFNASTGIPTTDIGLKGWDLGNFDGATNRKLSYDFEILTGMMATELSAALTWNLKVTDSNNNPNVFTPVTQLANLDLRLFDVTGSSLLIDASLSTDYNLEHIYLTSLAAGRYRFEISGDNVSSDYGFSWRINTMAIPEPSTGMLIGLISVVVLCQRRRRR